MGKTPLECAAMSIETMNKMQAEGACCEGEAAAGECSHEHNHDHGHAHGEGCDHEHK